MGATYWIVSVAGLLFGYWVFDRTALERRQRWEGSRQCR